MNLDPLFWLPFTYRQRCYLGLHAWRFDARLSYGHRTAFRAQKHRFLQCHGYPLDLASPRSFNEKIWYKKIFDRNPLIPVVADKLRVRDHVRSVLGNTVADQILIPLLHATRDPADIPFGDLPSDYIIKSNYGSGCNLIVSADRKPSRRAIIRTCQRWLCKAHGITNLEWAYQGNTRHVLIEKLLKDERSPFLYDYKFHMIHGRCAFIQVDIERGSNHSRRLYTPTWQPLNVQYRLPIGPVQKPPTDLDRLSWLAEQLSAGFDYIRIDLYSVAGKSYFGEMTNYPASGLGRFTPRSFDDELGSQWSLPRGGKHPAPSLPEPCHPLLADNHRSSCRHPSDAWQRFKAKHERQEPAATLL